MSSDDHDDGMPWGWLREDGSWVKLPKPPMLLAGMGPPPFDVKMPDGSVRHITHAPHSTDTIDSTAANNTA